MLPDLFESVLMHLWKRAESWMVHKLFFLYHKHWKGRLELTRTNALDQLRVLHKSDHFLVVNKQHDLVINTEEGDNRLSLFEQIQHKYPELHQPSLGHGFYVVHRLDYSTSGVMVIPLSKQAVKQAARQFEERKTRKFYLSLIRGHVDHDRLLIDIPIGGDSRPEWSQLRMSTPATDPDCLRPREAKTRLVVLERGSYSGQPATKVLMYPLTGRRHQLRLHCHQMGHTIVGDWVYSGRRDVFPHRMFLHAHRLILHTKLEQLDITTGPDPFSSQDPVNLWTPSPHVISSLDSAYRDLVDTDIQWTRVS